MLERPFDHTTAEVERYELNEANRYAFQADRREFVQVLGAGVMVVVGASGARSQRRGRRSRRQESLSQRFHIGQNGIVTVLTSKVEVGQGARTQISQAAAEELRLDVRQVRLIMADTARCPDDGGTAGSRTTPSTVPRVRKAAAVLSRCLSELAAQQLGVDAADITFQNGRFSNSGENGHTSGHLTLDQLVQAVKINDELSSLERSTEISVAPVSRWDVLGTDVKSVTGCEIVTGTARYPSDTARPGMLYGKVVRPVALNATLTSIDLSPARTMKGVTVVRDGDFVGCAADTSWRARKACDAVAATATWQTVDDGRSSDRLFEHLKATAQNESSRRRRDERWGDCDAALASARHRLSSQYTVAYVQHAPMEPRAAVAEWNDGQLTVWTGTQQPSRVKRQLSETFRLDDDAVRVHVPDTGGGFGGKHTGEAAVEAARLAKAAGRPVHLRWSREEEFTWAYFRPAGLIEVDAGIDTSDRLIAWKFWNYNSGGSAIQTPYTVANGHTRFVRADSPLRQGSYRALASTANTFARECAMDELAERAGEDPLAFRLTHLPPGRLRDVLQAAAARFDWSTRTASRAKQHDGGARRGIGLSCGTEKGSYTAACVEVEVTDGEIHVLHVCQAFECGAIQNPANLRRQVEGCLVMGLGAALYEAIEFANGQILTSNFSNYRVPRMTDVPELEIVLLDRPQLPSVGAGETPIIAIAPAVANAVYIATGTRCRSMPLKID